MDDLLKLLPWILPALIIALYILAPRVQDMYKARQNRLIKVAEAERDTELARLEQMKLQAKPKTEPAREEEPPASYHDGLQQMM